MLSASSGLVGRIMSFVSSFQKLPEEWTRPSADKFSHGGSDSSSQFQGVCFSSVYWLEKVPLISLQQSIG